MPRRGAEANMVQILVIRELSVMQGEWYSKRRGERLCECETEYCADSASVTSSADCP